MGNQRYIFGAMCCLLMLVLCGCDPVTRHKVTSTIFDGVPSLPEPEQLCQEYHEKKLSEEQEGKAKKATDTVAASSMSTHPPYGQKKCEKCHDKTKDSGLIRPRNEICFVCHPKIIKKSYVHGPAAVGGCLECHDPHSSKEPSLLKVEKAVLCLSCHREVRVAAGMHSMVTAKGLLCMECHNPHAGDAPFFLR